jgi:nitrous oxidase accessory protein NosD
MSHPTLFSVPDHLSMDRGLNARKALLRLGVGIPALAVGLLGPVASASAGEGHSSTVHVSADGTDSDSCGDSNDPCRTIAHGVDLAQPGGSVDVGPGTYHEQVVVSKRLDLEGDDAIIDASGLQSGSGATLNAAALLLTGEASGSSVGGFAVRGAVGEGILVMSLSHVRIHDNSVTGNDLGTPATTAYLECQPQGEVPGDCGEGVHLMSTSWSSVENNESSGNSGGFLVTDEFGPATGNRIAGNLAKENATDCGITLPSHNPNALSADGKRQPDTGGVYGNVVSRNTVVSNGLKGEGAGVLIAAAGPGMASYANKVVGNVIRDNSMAGVTIHSHSPNQDVSDNVIAYNAIGTNNVNGDPDANVHETTGILVFSAVVPQSEIIKDNDIHGNNIPIYTPSNITLP